MRLKSQQEASKGGRVLKCACVWSLACVCACSHNKKSSIADFTYLPLVLSEVLPISRHALRQFTEAEIGVGLAQGSAVLGDEEVVR